MQASSFLSSPHRRTLAVLIAACVAAAAVPALAAEPAAFASATGQFMQALEGRDDAVEPAIDEFGKLSQAEPQDPVLRAYTGAATALRARVALMPWKKMNA